MCARVDMGVDIIFSVFALDIYGINSSVGSIVGTGIVLYSWLELVPVCIVGLLRIRLDIGNARSLRYRYWCRYRRINIDIGQLLLVLVLV